MNPGFSVRLLVLIMVMSSRFIEFGRGEFRGATKLQLPDNIWDSPNLALYWQDYYDESDFKNIIFNFSHKLTSFTQKKVEIIQSSKEARYNCAVVYRQCVESSINRKTCSKTATEVLRNIAKFERRESHCAENWHTPRSSAQSTVAYYSVEDFFERIVHITFIVLGDSTEESFVREQAIRSGWGRHEDVLFVHDENRAMRLFPLMLDLSNADSKLYRPCSTVYFFVKSDTYVNATSLRAWINAIRPEVIHKSALYGGSDSRHCMTKNSSRQNDREDDLHYDVNYTLRNIEAAVRENTGHTSRIPFATWESGILLNHQALRLIVPEIILNNATDVFSQRLKEQIYKESFCFSHGVNNLGRLAKCLKSTFNIPLTQFSCNLFRVFPLGNCDKYEHGTEGRNHALSIITTRQSSANYPCFDASCKMNSVDRKYPCATEIESVLPRFIFLVPTCARYIHRLLAWLEHINITVTRACSSIGVNENTYVRQSQIFTVVSDQDDVAFVKTTLSERGYTGVSVILAKGIKNDRIGAQIKPLHAFAWFHRQMTSENPPSALLEARWIIHVDDDTSINLVAVALKVAQYDHANPVMLTKIHDSHVPHGAATTISIFSRPAFDKLCEFATSSEDDWMHIAETSSQAVHLFDVWYGTMSRKLQFDLINIDGVSKHFKKTHHGVMLAEELHVYTNYSQAAHERIRQYFLAKADVFVRQNCKYIFGIPVSADTNNSKLAREISVPKNLFLDTSQFEGNIGLKWRGLLTSSTDKTERGSIVENFLKLYSPILQQVPSGHNAHNHKCSSVATRVHAVAIFEENPLISFANHNFCHSLNDIIIPLYALSTVLGGSDSQNLVVLKSEADGLLINCAGVSKNLRTIGTVLFACDRLADNAEKTVRQQHRFCSDKVFRIDRDGWSKWWRLWSVHINAGYNWSPSRLLLSPTFHGRDSFAISLLYQALSAQLFVRFGEKMEEKGSLPLTIFSNRQGKTRQVINMNDIVTALALSTEIRSAVIIDKKILYFESMSIQDVSRRLSSAHIWVSPHGANMANMIFLRKNAAVIEILPYRCQRLRVFFQSMASALGLRYYSTSPTRAMELQGFEDPSSIDDLAATRRLCDFEQCINTEKWEYMNFRIEEGLVSQKILQAVYTTETFE